MVQTEGFRLSPQQRRLWRLLDAGGPPCRAEAVVRIEGDLDRAALRQALDLLVERHEILRTTFPRLPGLQLPVQVIAASANGHGASALVELDLAERGEAEQEEEIRALFAGASGRFWLVRRSPQRHDLLLSLPALVADAGSVESLFRELGPLYEGRALAEPMQYADFSEWQNEMAEQEGPGREHWRRLDRASWPALAFPFERRRPGSAPARPWTGRLGGERLAALEALAARCGAGLQDALLALWQVACWRFSGTPDVLVACLADGRRYEDLQGAVGLYDRTLPIPGRLRDDLPFADLLRATAAAVREAVSWQEHWQDEAAAEPLPSFELRSRPAAYRAGGLAFALAEHGARLGPVRLHLEGLREEADLLLRLSCDPRCDPDGAARLGEAVLALAGAAVARPSAPVGDLDLATGDPARLEGSAAAPPYRGGLHERVLEQAARTPDAPALIWEGRPVAYRELARSVERVADLLRGRGVEAEAPVAVRLERSPDLPAALLGVLAAGGIYVALDPDAPPARTAALLDEVRPVCLLTRDDLGGAAAGETRRPPAPAAGAAYVTFTSGSTGRPKGILGTFGGVSNYLEYVLGTHGLGPDDAVLQIAAPSFDASLRDLFAALLVGGRTVLLSDRDAADPAALLAAVREHGATCLLSVVPTMLRALTRRARETGTVCPSVRLVLVSGESLYEGDCRAAREVFPSARLVNQYGPSECTMTSTWQRVEAEEGEVPIGAPIPGARVSLLSPFLRAVPAGVAGEVFLGGAGLTRGYFGRPDLTAERFLPDPFSAEPGARLYRTGDLARLRSDGRLEFLGRIDRQIKVLGVRVEPGEVESLLREHDTVAEAAVVAREQAAGGLGLAAYVVPRAGAAVDRAALQAFLRERLPRPMRPSSVTVLDSLPRTRTGKLDRAALPEPAASAAVAEERDPTPAEELIAGIWAEVLGHEPPGLAASFFELGGHSLLATQVVARIQETFGCELPLREIFEHPTVAGLARAVQEALDSDLAAPLPPILPGPREGVRPASFAQQRLWLLHQLDPEDRSYNVARLLRMKGALDASCLARALDEIERRHDSLRTTFALADEPVQIIAPPRPRPLPVVDLGGLPAEARHREEAALIRRESFRPFDLGRGPVARRVLLRLDAGEHALLLVFHHIVCDEWSLGVFVRELTALYAAFLQGEPSPLPDLPVQYADFAGWQRRWLQESDVDRLLEFWRRQLPDGIPPLALPGERRAAGSRGGYRALSVKPETSAALRAIGRREGATPFMTLLAALQVLLHPYAPGGRLAVGTDVASRTRPEVEPLVGFFVNVLLLPGDLRGDPTFLELLRRVRETALEVHARQAVPFDRLVAELEPEREAGVAAPIQVLFVLQNTRRPPIAMPGLELEASRIDTETAKFDLLLVMHEAGDGFAGSWRYRLDRFDEATVARLSGRFTELLDRIAAEPESRLSRLERQETDGERQTTMDPTVQKDSRLKMFMSIQPKAVSVTQADLVRTSALGSSRLPLVFEPAGEGIDLVDWATSNRQLLEEKLLDHGALLFRGFRIDSPAEFERFAQSQCGELYGEYGDLPRDSVAGKVYTSTPYPPEHRILYHNESSQMHCWPLKQLFFCVLPAQEGGETPIVDGRRVYRELDPAIRERFRDKGVMYTRNFTAGLDVSLEEFFRTSDRAAIESSLKSAGIEFEWKPDGGLRTHKVCPAVARHPKTGETVFFNQIQAHHVSFLEPEVREVLLATFGEENLPRNVYFGDGTPIDDGILREVLAVYEASAVGFPWREGDLLMLDNMLTAHSRNAYKGPRKILVAMGEMVSADAVQVG